MMLRAFLITIAVGAGLIVYGFMVRGVNVVLPPPGQPKGVAADLSMEDRATLQTEQV